MSSISFNELKKMDKKTLQGMFSHCFNGKKLTGMKNKKGFLIKKLMKCEIDTRTTTVELFGEKDRYIFRKDIEEYASLKELVPDMEKSCDSSSSSESSEESSDESSSSREDVKSAIMKFLR